MSRFHSEYESKLCITKATSGPEMLRSLMSRFTEHPRSVGETYLQHALQSMYIAATMALASWAAVLHALFPFLFQTTAGDVAIQLAMHVLRRRQRTGHSRNIRDAWSDASIGTKHADS